MSISSIKFAHIVPYAKCISITPLMISIKLIDFHKSLTEDLLEIEKVGGKNIIFWEDKVEFKFKNWKKGKLGSSLLKDSI